MNPQVIGYRALTAVAGAQVQGAKPMPHRHNRKGRSVHTAVNGIHQDRPVLQDTWQNASIPALESGCVAHARCDRPVMPAAPVRLCAHHVREVYVYAQDLITERLIPVVDDLVAEHQAQQQVSEQG